MSDKSSRPDCIGSLSEVEPLKFSRAGGEIEAAQRDIGVRAGARLIGVGVTEIGPGKKASYLHRHRHKEEFFYVLSGRCRLRLDEREIDLAAGDFVSRPAGSPEHHQFFNPFQEPCSVLMLGVMAGKGLQDEVDWPELKRTLRMDEQGKVTIQKKV
jgi:uncharacterized cupin superfamily protein